MKCSQVMSNSSRQGDTVDCNLNGIVLNDESSNGVY